MYFFKNLFTSEPVKNHDIQEEKKDRETIVKERRLIRREEERLNKLNREEWEQEYDEYLDWYEKEEAREQMLETIDNMFFKF